MKSLSTFAICCIYVIPNAPPNMDSLTKGTRCFLTRFKHINPTTVLELSCTKVHAKSESEKASKTLFKAQKGLKSYNKAHWILQHKSSERIWSKRDLTYTLWCLPWDALSKLPYQPPFGWCLVPCKWWETTTNLNWLFARFLNHHSSNLRLLNPSKSLFFGIHGSSVYQSSRGYFLTPLLTGEILQKLPYICIVYLFDLPQIGHLMIPDQIKPPVLVLCGLLPASASILPWADFKETGPHNCCHDMVWHVMPSNDMLCPSLSRVVGRVEVGSCKSHHVMKYELLVGGFNPFEKYACQIGSSPQVEVKINNIL